VKNDEGRVVTPEAVGMLVGITFEVETDPTGMPMRVVDLPGTLERIIAGLAKTGKQDERTKTYLRDMFTRMDAHSAASTLFKEQVAVAMFQNTQLAVGETRQIPAVAPNPLGGPAINMQQSLTLVQVNHNAKTAMFHFSSRLDPVSLSASMKAALAKMTQSVGDAARRGELEKQVSRSMQVDKIATADAEVSLIDGWLRRLTMSEEIALSDEADSGSRVDTMRIDIEHLR
jgi:hypothetical protein